MATERKGPPFYTEMVQLAKSSPWGVEKLPPLSPEALEYNYPLTVLAQEVAETAFKLHQTDLPLRWRNYGLVVEENGRRRYLSEAVAADGDIATHSRRQAAITALAAMIDNSFLTPEGIDEIVATAFIHDLGEITVGDVTYDVKLGGEKEEELREAKAALGYMQEAAQSLGYDSSLIFELSATYLYIATKLTEGDIKNLLGKNHAIDNWQRLRGLFRLYERYGYMITALQAWEELTKTNPPPIVKALAPVIGREQIETLSKFERGNNSKRLEELDAQIKSMLESKKGVYKQNLDAKSVPSILTSWRNFASELKQSAQRGQLLYPLKIIALVGNVISNQTPHIADAMSTNPSAQQLFGPSSNPRAKEYIAEFDQIAATHFADLLYKNTSRATRT